MIIRQVYRGKVFFQKRNAARRTAERIRLENLLSSLYDRAFQVADGNVGLLKDRGEFRKGIGAVDNGMAGPAVEHNVAGKNEPDSLLVIIGRESRIRPDNCRQQKPYCYCPQSGNKASFQIYQSTAHDLAVSSRGERKSSNRPLF